MWPICPNLLFTYFSHSSSELLILLLSSKKIPDYENLSIYIFQKRKKKRKYKPKQGKGKSAIIWFGIRTLMAPSHRLPLSSTAG